MSFSNKLQRTDGSSDGSEINRLGDDQTIFVKSLDKIIEISFNSIFIRIFFKIFNFQGDNFLKAFGIVDYEYDTSFSV